MKRYVIIGNSAAAAGCIEGIRQADRRGSITVISREPHHIYSRPLISYLLSGKTDLERMKYRPDDYYWKYRVNAVLGQEAVKIDAGQQFVLLQNGQGVPYDELLVATGSRPLMPEIAGLETVRQVFTFQTLDDALALQQALTPESRVLIIGAGLIGLKCAEGIFGKAAEISVVDLSERVLSSILNTEGSERVQRHLEQQGISFFLADQVERLDGGTAFLKSGKTAAFDILVVAAGVRPNVSLVAEAGGDVRRGIVVDRQGKTSLPHLYAAGDCVESVDVTTGQSRVMALLPNAYLQGEAAGLSMAGKEKKAPVLLPMNAMGLFGLHLITAGSYVGQAVTVENGENYHQLFFRDGVLKGYLLIGDVRRAGIYTSLIREETPLEEIDFEQMKNRPQLIALSAQKRQQALAQPH